MLTQNTNLVKIGSGVYRLATEIYTDIGLKTHIFQMKPRFGFRENQNRYFQRKFEFDPSVSSIISL